MGNREGAARLAVDAPVDDAAWQSFYKVFRVPEGVRQYAPRLFDPLQVRFAVEAPERFDERAAAIALEKAGADPAGAHAFLERQYKIGFLNLTDDSESEWELAGYATFMDVWCVWENEEYRSRFTPEELSDIDWKYFHASFDPRAALAAKEGVAPSEDEVYTLQETLDWIDENGKPSYLSYCDCRSFAGECGTPRNTCISYLDGINTYAHRGWAKKLTVEQTKDAIREFDRAGLMHTLNGHTICNCCGDCCYLSRGRDQIGSGPNWPLAHNLVALDAGACIGCGRCIKRCWRDVFTRTGDRKVEADTSRCVGCGLCASTCPTHALTMVPTEFPGLAPKEDDPARVRTH